MVTGSDAGAPVSLDMSPVRSVTVTIDLDAIRHNLEVARQLSGSKLFAVVKADAYGHGAIAVARALDRADGFAVVTLDEAVALREAGVRQPVLLLQGPQHPNDCAALEQYGLWPVLHDEQQLAWYAGHAIGRSLPAWLKVDTGMGRLGVTPARARVLLGESTVIRWMGVLSHLACADTPGNAHTHAQLATFNDLPAGSRARSIANSAAILAWPDARADWARPGLMLYGCNPLEVELPAGVSLQPAMHVVAPLISVKWLEAGASVGYACRWRCPEAMPVGLVGIGYGDGLPRVLDASARVRIAGRECAIIGRVSMDSIAVDLRGVAGVLPGEPVTLWGNGQPVERLALSAGTISYELLTGMKGKRVYRTGGATALPPRNVCHSA